jgi:hypothetical protein
MNEQVPSWQVTSEQLEAWGFPLRKTDKCVGSKVIISEGMSFGEAVHAAWAAGFVRIAAMPDHVREAQIAEFHAGLAENTRVAVETLAHLRKHGLIVEGHGTAAIRAASA